MTHTTFIAHGSSRPEARRFLKDLIADIDKTVRINLGFSDFGEPDIPTALQEQIRAGARKLRVIPLFIVPGKHKDIPPIIEAVRGGHRGVKIVLEEPMGARPEFKEMLTGFLTRSA